MEWSGESFEPSREDLAEDWSRVRIILLDELLDQVLDSQNGGLVFLATTSM